MVRGRRSHCGARRRFSGSTRVGLADEAYELASRRAFALTAVAWLPLFILE